MNTYPTPGRPPQEIFDYTQLKYLAGALIVPARKLKPWEVKEKKVNGH